MNGQYVVILTGGAKPGDETSRTGPASYQLDLAVQNAGTHPDPAVMGRRLAEEGWHIGYREAALLQRVVAVWVLDDEEEAKRFAEFVTREVDPAYVTRSLSPLNEVLNAAIDPAACKAHPDDCPNGPEPHLYVPADSDRLVLCCHQPGEGEKL